MSALRMIKPCEDLAFRYASKLLFYSLAPMFKDRSRQHYPSLVFKFAMFGVFLEHISPIRDTVGLCTVLYNNQKQIDRLLMESRLDLRQVFKSFYGKTIHVERRKGFLIEAAYNLLGLLKEKTIRISSDTPSLRDFFFFLLEQTNTKLSTGCLFDFDNYDAEITLKQYLSEDRVHLIMTVDSKAPITQRREEA